MKTLYRAVDLFTALGVCGALAISSLSPSSPSSWAQESSSRSSLASEPTSGSSTPPTVTSRTSKTSTGVKPQAPQAPQTPQALTDAHGRVNRVIGLEMVRARGGEVMKGDQTQGQATQSQTAQDTQSVKILKLEPFYISTTEITVGHYRQCVSAAVCDSILSCEWGESTWSDQPSDREYYPITCVTWHQARTFARWAGGDLPSDAQWIHAARSSGRDSLPYAGSTQLREVGWSLESAEGRLHPVRQKKPNRLGLYDMTGNVWEWVLDAYQNSSEGSLELEELERRHQSDSCQASPCKEPRYRTRRGGSVDSNAISARIEYRSPYWSGSGSEFLGFRIVRSEDQERRQHQIIDQATQALLKRWVEVQNQRNFNSYSSLYDSDFKGVKRAGKKTRQFDRAGWLKDRARMFSHPFKVSVSDIQITHLPHLPTRRAQLKSMIKSGVKPEVKSGANPVSTPSVNSLRLVEVMFTQRWESARFADQGRKRIILAYSTHAPLRQRLRIVSEEMLTSLPILTEHQCRHLLRRRETETFTIDEAHRFTSPRVLEISHHEGQYACALQASDGSDERIIVGVFRARRGRWRVESSDDFEIQERIISEAECDPDPTRGPAYTLEVGLRAEQVSPRHRAVILTLSSACLSEDDEKTKRHVTLYLSKPDELIPLLTLESESERRPHEGILEATESSLEIKSEYRSEEPPGLFYIRTETLTRSDVGEESQDTSREVTWYEGSEEGYTPSEDPRERAEEREGEYDYERQ